MTSTILGFDMVSATNGANKVKTLQIVFEKVKANPVTSVGKV